MLIFNMVDFVSKVQEANRADMLLRGDMMHVDFRIVDGVVAPPTTFIQSLLPLHLREVFYEQRKTLKPLELNSTAVRMSGRSISRLKEKYTPNDKFGTAFSDDEWVIHARRQCLFNAKVAAKNYFQDDKLVSLINIYGRNGDSIIDSIDLYIVADALLASIDAQLQEVKKAKLVIDGKYLAWAEYDDPRPGILKG